MTGKPVVNMFEAPAMEWGRGSKYQAKLARLGDAGQAMRAARIAFIGKQEDSLDYWDGEDIGETEE